MQYCNALECPGRPRGIPGDPSYCEARKGAGLGQMEIAEPEPPGQSRSGTARGLMLGLEEGSETPFLIIPHAQQCLMAFIRSLHANYCNEIKVFLICTWPTYALLISCLSRCRPRWTTPPSPHRGSKVYTQKVQIWIISVNVPDRNNWLLQNLF